MGNYTDFEPEFITRTINLIEQYNQLVSNLKFKEQLNYTLTINCLLGLIVMPKERVISYIPNTPITEEYKTSLGFVHSTIGSNIPRFRDLIHQLRNSIAHFKIEVVSETEDFLVDYLVFKDTNNNMVARIKASEIVPFLKFYSNELLRNLQRRNGL